MSDDECFGGGDSGASESYPSQASALRKGGHVLIKEKPCKIVEMSTSKTGKHGHAKVHLVALDIFTGKKYEDICPSTHNMNVPNVIRKDFLVVGADPTDQYLSIMHDNGDVKQLHCKNNELFAEILGKFEKDQEFNVTVISAMGYEEPIALKTANTTKRE